MFWRRKIRLDRNLYDRAADRARALGAPSVEVYVAQLIERDLKVGEEDALREQALRQMKGLGYLE
jgi:hypothetical protein